MRDILVTLLVFGSLPFILKRPYIGVLVWAWLSYMNPHRMTWSFAYNMPFAQIVAVTLFVAILFSKEKKSIPVNGLLVVWLAFLAWMTITTFSAIYQDWAFYYYDRAIKIQILTFVTILCMTDQKRIDLLIWTICLSIGFFSIKGGIFTLLTAGQYRVYGPPDSFIGENNALALATLMTIPLMYYLRYIATHNWVRWGLTAAMFFSGLSVLGSQSRGALVAILALAGYFWLQTRGKVVSGVAIVILGILALSFMPGSWHERMETIRNYQEDPSAMSRIAAWNMSFNLANKRLTGGGFLCYTKDTYAIYYGEVKKAFVAHSIYFSILGEHGWPGLILFLAILIMTLRNLARISKKTRGDPELAKYDVLARMLTLSLVAYMSGGAFLSLAYFDLPWHIIAIAFLVRHQLATQYGGPQQTKELARSKKSKLSGGDNHPEVSSAPF